MPLVEDRTTGKIVFYLGLEPSPLGFGRLASNVEEGTRELGLDGTPYESQRVRPHSSTNVWVQVPDAPLDTVYMSKEAEEKVGDVYSIYSLKEHSADFPPNLRDKIVHVFVESDYDDLWELDKTLHVKPFKWKTGLDSSEYELDHFKGTEDEYDEDDFPPPKQDPGSVELGTVFQNPINGSWWLNTLPIPDEDTVVEDVNVDVISPEWVHLPKICNLGSVWVEHQNENIEKFECEGPILSYSTPSKGDIYWALVFRTIVEISEDSSSQEREAFERKQEEEKEGITDEEYYKRLLWMRVYPQES